MRKITIDRTKWQRGGDLANGDRFDFMSTTLWSLEKSCGCCLGHVLHQAHGMSYSKMSGEGDPADMACKNNAKNPLVSKSSNVFNGQWNFENSVFTLKAISVNDDIAISDKKRESKLITLFKKNGYELTFVN